MLMCCCLTAKDKGEKKLFGYSFVPLMQEDGRTLPDGVHELIIHKVKEKKKLALTATTYPERHGVQTYQVPGNTFVYLYLVHLPILFCLLVICSLKALD